jgi:hypothetical protein
LNKKREKDDAVIKFKLRRVFNDDIGMQAEETAGIAGDLNLFAVE